MRISLCRYHLVGCDRTIRNSVTASSMADRVQSSGFRRARQFPAPAEIVPDINALDRCPLGEVDRIRRYAVIGDVVELDLARGLLPRVCVADVLIRAEQLEITADQVLETSPAVGEAPSAISMPASLVAS